MPKGFPFGATLTIANLSDTLNKGFSRVKATTELFVYFVVGNNCTVLFRLALGYGRKLEN